MLKSIIIDDDKQHREYLRDMIENHFPGVTVEGESSNVTEGIQLVNSCDFDLVFLDVQMPPLSGFDVLRSANRRNFEVVFTTSYDAYALEAIKFSALDYLLKPYTKEELGTAVEKYYSKARQVEAVHKIDNLLHNINPENKRKRIGLSDKNGITFYDIDDILYCKSDNVYTTFYFSNHDPVVVSKPIKDYEKEFSTFPFYRIHNSFLVNLTKVHKYIRGDGGQVQMINNSMLDVSRLKKEGFLEKLGTL
jgi:two-component system LytT family response regulator